MQTLVFEIGEKPVITLESIRGDLRLSGRQGDQIEIKAYSDDVDIAQEGDSLRINCPSDTLIFLPSESRIEGGSIGGDVRATNIRGEISLRTVGGDLSLRGVGSGSFETIGGDFHARKGTGNIQVDRVGSDAVVDRISGNVTLRHVGGDLRLRRVDGTIEISAGGDASVMLTTMGGKKLFLKAGGDLSCSLPGDASASVTLTAGGDVHLPGTIAIEEAGSSRKFVLGDGDTPVELVAGGDLWFQGEETSDSLAFADLGETIASQVETEVEAGIAEMEARLEALGAGMGTYSSDRIGEQVRRAVTRARRKAERGRKRAGRARRRAEKKTRSINFSLSGRPSRRAKVSEEERISILRMLENGTITVEEAEKLLQAIEGDL
jgi:hypothetical protein